MPRRKLTFRRLLLLRILPAAVLVWLLGGLLMPFPRCKVLRLKVASLNALAVDLEVAGRTILLDMHYPRDRVLLCDPGDDGSFGIPYEHNYKVGSPFIGPHRHEGVYLPAPGFPLSPVKYAPEDLGTRLALYGMSGEAMARVEGAPHEKPLMDAAVRAYLGRRDTLATCLTPRLRVEQLIRGAWTPLSQYNLVGMCYYCAPEDTIRIRMTPAVMKAVFLRDRVLIKPATRSEQEAARVIVRKPRDGYWPYYHSWTWEQGKEFFKTFQADTLKVGERFEFEYPLMPYQSVFTLDILGSMLVAEPYIQQIVFCQPTLGIQGHDDPETLRNWPLVPTPSGLAEGERAEPGYPGGFILPRWAFERQLELGLTSGSDRSNNPNMIEYKDELAARRERKARERKELKEKEMTGRR